MSPPGFMLRYGSPVAQVWRGDCGALEHTRSCWLTGKAALIYLDPPWFTQTNHGAFDDRWESLDAYLGYIRERLLAMQPMLEPHGSVVIHCDSHASHALKLLGDEVFGRGAFASEIIWRYRRWPTKTNNFQRVHDALLRWVANPAHEPRWNQLYEPLAPSTRKQWGDGKQQAIVVDGKRKRSSVIAAKSPGVPLGDVWDIPIIAPRAHERTGYPTQKPLALLERLIAATTAPGDIVLDPMCGSGTTLIAARKLKRSAIGIDISDKATTITADRLLAFEMEQIRMVG